MRERERVKGTGTISQTGFAVIIQRMGKVSCKTVLIPLVDLLKSGGLSGNQMGNINEKHADTLPKQEGQRDSHINDDIQ